MTYEDDAEYDPILRAATGAAASTGPLVLLLVPGLDFTVMAGIWGTMIVNIASRNGVAMDRQSAVRIATAIITGFGAYAASAKTFVWAIGKIPGIGWVAAGGINSAANAIMTLWLGFALIDLFDREKPTTLEDYVKFLISELRPKINAGKMARSVAFFQRMGSSR